MWFQQDGCPAHYSLAARREVDNQFTNRWIGRQGPVEWPARSPDHIPLDFFLWGYLKNKIYTRTPTSPEALKGDLVQPCLAIPRDMVRRTTSSVGDRLIKCSEKQGGLFEN